MRTFEDVPILKNERHELFAQKLAEGKSATEAYQLAGFKPSRKNASRLRAIEGVRARVLEIQAAAAKSAEITLEGVLRELDDAIAIAKHKNQPNAMVNAASLRARLGGLLIERQEVRVGELDPPEPQNPDELYRTMADQRLDGLTNARWLPISEQDRQELADLFRGWLEAIDRFVDKVNRRPLIEEHAVGLITNGRKS